VGTLAENLAFRGYEEVLGAGASFIPTSDILGKLEEFRSQEEAIV